MTGIPLRVGVRTESGPAQGEVPDCETSSVNRYDAARLYF